MVSPRARITVYAALRQLGREGIADLTQANCQSARSLVSSIARLNGAELVWIPDINQGLVRFNDPCPDASQDGHDNFTDAVTDAIAHSGEAFFSNTTWRGKRCMKISVCNWQTNAEDVQRSITTVANILKTMGWDNA